MRSRLRGALVAVLSVVMVASLGGTAVAVAPANDEVTEATIISAVPYSDVIDTTDATWSSEDPRNCTGSKTVWYAHTAEQTRRLVANTFGSDHDTILAVFEDTPTNEAMVACNYDFRGSQSRASFDVEAGKTYYFMVSSTGGELHFNLAVAVPPPNDDIDDAKNISNKMPWKFTADTTEATLDITDPSCEGKSRSVWFKYTRPKKWGSRRVELNTFGSDYDTVLSVYSGRPGNLERIRCSDNAAGYQSKLFFKAEPGKTYWIMVGSARNSAGGKLKLTAKQPPIPLRVEAGVDSSGTVSSVTGAATVGGFVKCSRKTTVTVSVMLRQRNDDHVVSDSVRKAVNCNGRKRWSTTLTASRPFEPGSAGLWATIMIPGDKPDRHDKKVIQLSTCSQCL